MRLLDLFCGAGGSAMGYFQAGVTDIVGVDIRPMPRYPFTFVQGDALEYLVSHGQDFDVIHASPPCQPYSKLRQYARRGVPALVSEVRQALRASGRPYVIENVVGAPLDGTLLLCGSMFGLQTASGAHLQRHRWFESSLLLWSPGACDHHTPVIGVQGHHWRQEALYMAARRAGRTVAYADATFTLAQAQEAMGIAWMTRADLSQAIPPAYTCWIGRLMLHALRQPSERGWACSLPSLL